MRTVSSLLNAVIGLFTVVALLSYSAKVNADDTHKNPVSHSLASQTPVSQSLSYGQVFEHQSQIFAAKRRYMVALPERYHMQIPGTQRHYSVLYVIDGDFQFRHVSAAAHTLARMGKIPPLIVVGIAMQGQKDYLYANTWESEKEGSEFGGSDKLQAYLSQELIPLIDSEYRTTDAKALSGYSLGGLFTLYSMIQESTPFNAFLAFSPSAWYDGNNIEQQLQRFLKTKPKTELFMTLANEKGMGVAELDKLFSAHTDQNLRYGYQVFADETHYSTAMPSIVAGLEFLAPNYYVDLDPMLEFADYQALLAHFKRKQSQWAGFRFDWLQAYHLAKYLFRSKQHTKVDQVLAAIKQDFPESYLEVVIAFSKGFVATKDPQKSLQILKQVSAQGEHHPNWHQQMSKTYEALDNSRLAKQHHQQAVKLAKQYQYESWGYWELAPDAFTD
ncbi:alpha/beta hydrolase [Shewanella maritima]|uniref:Alpha/beta hydrolase n=1 Tax=Shewanella maritima TaxID=2520507 RepID=A0A411PJR3_9GAMM|nr:alpha/beta hydrolase-fold protein [Shewanella maritima]QBF83728.1 alpha/beta hydrolase [Shewanella maritima]